MKKYFIVGNKMLCFIPRNGSTAFCNAIIDTYYPELKDSRIGKVQFRTPKAFDNGEMELLALFRHPVERFLSGCAHIKYTVAQGIENIQTDRINIHLIQQHKFLSEKNPTKLYRFPDQINEVAEYLGLPVPLKRMNASIQKPPITDEQLQFITNFYAKDYILYENTER